VCVCVCLSVEGAYNLFSLALAVTFSLWCYKWILFDGCFFVNIVTCTGSQPL